MRVQVVVTISSNKATYTVNDLAKLYRDIGQPGVVRPLSTQRSTCSTCLFHMQHMRVACFDALCADGGPCKTSHTTMRVAVRCSLGHPFSCVCMSVWRVVLFGWLTGVRGHCALSLFRCRRFPPSLSLSLIKRGQPSALLSAWHDF